MKYTFKATANYKNEYDEDDEDDMRSIYIKVFAENYDDALERAKKTGYNIFNPFMPSLDLKEVEEE